ncbi:MAG: ankyrin repeat domain-containing protein [Opitutus sp.]
MGDIQSNQKGALVRPCATFLEHCVDPVDVHGNTPLWRAVFNSCGRGELIELLISRGADPTKKNKSGTTPKDLAETIANYEVAKFLK